MGKGFVFFFNTPILQYSRVETFKNFWQFLNYFFIDHSSALISKGGNEYE